MIEDNNIHQGHRRRMLEKAKSNADQFSDHELLEILLFYAIPRQDTNALAHRLLRIFGSLKNVCSASVEELCAIDGVGERTAIMLCVMGKTLDRIKQNSSKPIALCNYEQVKKHLINEYHGVKSETCKFFLLDQKFKRIACLNYGDMYKFKVSVDVNELVSATTVLKPTYVIMTHNHVSEDCSPSQQDKITTRKVNFICSVHGVNLIDHVIIRQDGQMYSFRQNGLMDMIKNELDIDKIFSAKEE